MSDFFSLESRHPGWRVQERAKHYGEIHWFAIIAYTHIHKTTTNKNPYCFSREREWFSYLISSVEPMPYSIRWVAIAPTCHSPPSTTFTGCLVLTVGHLRDFLGKKNVWRNLFLSSFFSPPRVWWSLKDFLRKCWSLAIYKEAIEGRTQIPAA